MLWKASLTNSVSTSTIMPIKKTVFTLFHAKGLNVSSLAQLGLYFFMNHEYNQFKVKLKFLRSAIIQECYYSC